MKQLALMQIVSEEFLRDAAIDLPEYMRAEMVRYANREGYRISSEFEITVEKEPYWVPVVPRPWWRRLLDRILRRNEEPPQLWCVQVRAYVEDVS